MTRALLISLALGTAGLAPALAQSGLGAMMPVLLSEVLRDTETGARAGVIYVNRVMTGGTETIIDADGKEQVLHWDGLKGVFEVDFAISGGVMAPDVAAFVREAVAAVCPSVDAAALGKSPVRRVTDTLYQIDAQCPALDAEAGQ